MSIEAILALGDDAMSNMFHLIFPNGIPGATNSDAIALRMDQSVDPPEEAINVYEIFYKGIKVPKVGTMDDTSKELSMDVRLDQQWQVYDDLKAYKNICYNANTGTRLPEGIARTTIIIQAVDGQNNVVKTFTFKGVLLKSLKIGTFDQNSGEPIRLSLGFVFAKMEED